MAIDDGDGGQGEVGRCGTHLKVDRQPEALWRKLLIVAFSGDRVQQLHYRSFDLGKGNFVLLDLSLVFIVVPARDATAR